MDLRRSPCVYVMWLSVQRHAEKAAHTPRAPNILDKASEENRTESRNGCHERPSYFLAPAPPAAVPLASFILNFFFF